MSIPPVTNRILVMHLLNGLSSKFDNIINVIKHRFPACTFSQARSMLKDEEDKLNTKRQITSLPPDNASSAQILMASSSSSYLQASNQAPRHNFSDPQFSNHRGPRSTRGGQNSKGRGNPNWQGENCNFGPSPPWAWPNAPSWPMTSPWPNQPQWPVTWPIPPHCQKLSDPTNDKIFAIFRGF